MWAYCTVEANYCQSRSIAQPLSDSRASCKKERIVLREIHLRTTRRHLSNGITQCYLLPDRGGRPAFTPTGQVGTPFIDPVRMKG